MPGKISNGFLKKLREKKLNDALDLMGKTESGKEALDSIKKMGYGFTFEQGIDGLGCCDSLNKKILLSPSMNVETLSVLLSHEIRHAVQLEKDPELITTSRMRGGDTFKRMRGMEADACAHQAAFAYEAGKAGLALKMPEEYQQVFEAYSAEMNKTDNKKQAMNAAFKAWYQDRRMINWYDNCYARSISDAVDYLIDGNQKNGFCEKESDTRLATLFDYKGEPYVEPEFFSSPTAYNLRPNDKRKIMEEIKRYSQKTGAPADTSVLEMADRDESGKVVPNALKNQKTPALAALIAAKTKQR